LEIEDVAVMEIFLPNKRKELEQNTISLSLSNDIENYIVHLSSLFYMSIDTPYA